MREKDSVFLILFRKFGEHHTTNLGVSEFESVRARH